MGAMKFFLLLFSLSIYGAYKTEGFYAEYYDGPKRLDLIATFLPYNPRVYCDAGTPWKEKWPKGEVGFDDVDFVWVEGPLVETRNAKVLYLASGDVQEIRGYQFLSRWYWEGGAGHAIYLRCDIYDATMRTLIYSPPEQWRRSCYEYDLKPFLKSAADKSGEHGIDGIDFVYMINLDERPEKFELAAGGLQFYGINPYRFSAVNGWKLPTSVLNAVGARFSYLQDQYMGHVYKEVDGQEYLHSEFLQDDGEAYFVRGMAKGPIGIVLSHLSVLQDAYDSGFETIWVMEDDVEAVSDPREISGLIRKLDSLTDWDILFTDTDTTDPKGVKVPCRALPTRPNVFVPKLDVFMEKFYPIGDEFSRTGMRYGAYSMIVRRTGMKKILDYYRRAGVFIPYDMDFWLCSDLKMVCVNRDIVCHRKGALTDNHQPNY
jgi:GR25 family glycosyltransferase involved in LPS biosynthesis